MIKKKIGVSQDAKKLVLDLLDYELEASQISDRVSEIIPVLEAILSADIARDEIPEARLLELIPGILARDMIYQATLISAARNADLVHDVATEKRSIADLGFPDLVHPISQDD
jgi:hypothetical protein